MPSSCVYYCSLTYYRYSSCNLVSDQVSFVLCSMVADHQPSFHFHLFHFSVPKWILEGRCNMGLFMQHNSGKVDNNDDDPVTTIINRIEYFPHNDTLHAIYRCSHETNFRIRTCTFNDNVGNRIFPFLLKTHCLEIAQNVSFEFFNFPTIFVLSKVTCLVTLFDRKL